MGAFLATAAAASATVAAGNHAVAVPAGGERAAPLIKIVLVTGGPKNVRRIVVVAPEWLRELIENPWRFHAQVRVLPTTPNCKVTRVCDIEYPYKACLLSRFSSLLTRVGCVAIKDGSLTLFGMIEDRNRAQCLTLNLWFPV